MAAITKNAYSATLNKEEVENGFITTSQRGASQRVALIDFVATANVGKDEYILLNKLRKGTIILDAVIETDNATANATLTLGYVPISTLDDTNVGALISATAANDGSTRLTLKELGVCTTLTEDCYIVSKAGLSSGSGTAVASGKYIKGYITYVDPAS